METKELTILKSQISELNNQANEVIITTPEENLLATDLKAKLREIGKRIKERKEKITKPLNEALASARALFAPIELQYSSAEAIVGKKLLDYKQKVESEARVAAKKIADKLEAERIRLEKEVEAGNLTQEKADQKLDNKLDKAGQKIENLEQVAKTTHTTHGQVQFRKITKVKIVDVSKIPVKYLLYEKVVDAIRVAVREDAVTNNITIPGVEIYTEEIV